MLYVFTGILWENDVHIVYVTVASMEIKLARALNYAGPDPTGANSMQFNSTNLEHHILYTLDQKAVSRSRSLSPLYPCTIIVPFTLSKLLIWISSVFILVLNPDKACLHQKGPA